mgnify:CR=1 FL=1
MPTNKKLGHKKSVNKSQSGVIQAQMRAMANKKMPRTFDNSNHCSPIQMLDNDNIGDCVLATLLHLIKVQYSLVGKDFAINESTLWGLWGNSSSEKAYDLLKEILIFSQPEIYNANSSLGEADGCTVEEAYKYSRHKSLLGVKFALNHDLSEDQLIDIELLKKLIYYYGAVPAAVMLTEYEYTAVVNVDPPFLFDIPPGLNLKGIAAHARFVQILNTFTIEGYYSKLVGNMISYPKVYESVNSVEDFWNLIFYNRNEYTSFNGENALKVLVLKNLVNRSAYPINVSNKPNVYPGQTETDESYVRSDTYSAKASGSTIAKYAQTWDAWGRKSGTLISGHEVLLTGWDDTGFKFITWDGVGHMTYEYWLIHHVDANVLITDLWMDMQKGKNAKLLLNTLL